MNNKGNILVIDDEEIIRSLIYETLSLENYNVITLESIPDTKTYFKNNSFDTIISDINLPGKSGIQFLKEIRAFDETIPVILITGSTETENLLTAIKYGAYDFLRKPFPLSDIIVAVNNSVQKRKLEKENLKYKITLENMVVKRTEQLEIANKKLETNMIKTMMAMVNALEASDKYTRGHSERVTSLSLMIGEKMNLDFKDMKNLQVGAVLHDIGKIGIYHNILNKPTKLNDEEFFAIRQHPIIGYNIIKPIEFDQSVFDIVLQHHEFIDGTGYPNKLKGYQLNLLSKIVSVADTYDAITSDRPYRKGNTKVHAINEISKGIDIQFDREVVKVLIEIKDNITSQSLTNINVIKKYK
jgi:putative nucleotidyltransferase with HDIG domain